MDATGGGEVDEASAAPAPTEIRIEEYPEFCIPVVECPPFQPPWEDWPAWPPPPNWKYPDPIDAIHEACQPHKLPPNIDLAYGPFLPWTVKPASKPKSPTTDLPVREYLMAEKVYDLCLEAMKLAVIERPQRLVKFVALYIREKNPLACKVKCRRHCHFGETCHCKNIPPPPPPPPEPQKEEKKEGEEEEETAT